MKFRIILIPVLSIILCLFASGCQSKDKLSVITYNMHYGVGMDDRLDLQRLIDFFKKENPDVIFLQEADTNTKRSAADQPAEIAKALGMHVYHAPAMDFNGGTYGNAILSKYPLENTRTILLEGGYYPRSAGVAEIERNNKRIGLVSVHLDHERLDLHIQHMQLIMNSINKNSPHIPILMGGDFNADEKSDLWEFLSKKWFIPTKEGNRKTFSSDNPTDELDWFLFYPENAMKILRYSVIHEPMVSDHSPVLLEVEIE